MDKVVIAALDSLNVAALTRDDWLHVGMALKHEGYPVNVWDEWSRNDKRYNAKDITRTWDSFNGSGKPVTGGTIVKLAKDRGWTYSYVSDRCLDWDDVIQYDGDEYSPTEDLSTYLSVLFDESDKVSYVTEATWDDAKGGWRPTRGAYDRTAGELIASLKRYPDDIGATVGDWKQDVGAWIRFNPVDGEGVKNTNVTKFRYALVESDTLTLDEQYSVFRRHELPIAALVNSGGKSLHAIVKVDAKDIDEYKERVCFLYDFLKGQNVDIDTANKNPSRMSRMPGILRNGKYQKLVATNIGRRSWADWIDYVDGATDELPDVVTLADYGEDFEGLPPLAEPIIDGVLRRGHKMIVAGPPKAGKSFLLMQLAIAIAEGQTWAEHFPCRQGRVLYINLEVDRNSFLHRFKELYTALGKKPKDFANLHIWSLRGFAVPLDELTPQIIRRIKKYDGYDAVIIDPIYKVMNGDENNASEMGKFCNQFDKICTQTGAAVIYCHHHSKGAQGGKKAMDRSSGSGVFARDPDAIIDITPLEMTEDIKNNVRDGCATAFRMEGTLREFPNFKPIDMWFDYPIHRVDRSGELSGCGAEGSWQANFAKAGRYSTPQERLRNLERAFDVCADKGFCKVADMASYLDITSRSVSNHLKEFSDYFKNDRGFVTRVKQEENE